MCYETKRSAQKTTRHILSSVTERLKNKANREKKSGGIRPHKREKAPEGLFGEAGALGAAQRSRKVSLENGRERRGRLTCPEGLGRLVAPG